MSPSKRKIVFFLSGSIAAFKACQVISKLVQDGNEVQTVATPSALKFVGPATLEGLTGKRVLSDIWEEGRAMDHIRLTRWADVGVLCPASASTLARLANGLADDLVSAMALAWPRSTPLHIFPAMNHEMLAAPATQQNLRQLAEYGFRVHPTQAGNLACGEEGQGRLLEAEQILSALQPAVKGKILITSGATRESIDGVRFISNVSTGQTGAMLADLLMAKGYAVTYLHGESALKPSPAAPRVKFSDFISLDEALRAQLGQTDYNAIIHCAAVSDYSVAAVNGAPPDAGSKLQTESGMSISLKANQKILPRLKEYSRNKAIQVIGFKLLLNESPGRLNLAARELLQIGVDAVVANEWMQVKADRSRHPGTLIRRESETSFTNLESLADEIDSFLTEGAAHGPMS